MHLARLKTAPLLGAVICLALLSLTLATCKNPTGADEDTEPYITVQNSCGIALDIYMDGTFQFYLNNNEYFYIEKVTPGTHLLEAKKKDTDFLLKSKTVEIEANYSYTWTISSEAQLKITNKYGETLDIYGDGTYQSEVPDQTDALIPSVPYGEHTMEAKKQGGTTVVASVTIDFAEDVVYTWVIQK